MLLELNPYQVVGSVKDMSRCTHEGGEAKPPFMLRTTAWVGEMVKARRVCVFARGMHPESY